MNVGADALALAGLVFTPAVLEAVVFLVCFNVALEFMKQLRNITNPTKGGGES